MFKTSICLHIGSVKGSDYNGLFPQSLQGWYKMKYRDLKSTGSTGSWEPVKFQQGVPGTRPEIAKNLLVPKSFQKLWRQKQVFTAFLDSITTECLNAIPRASVHIVKWVFLWGGGRGSGGNGRWSFEFSNGNPSWKNPWKVPELCIFNKI